MGLIVRGRPCCPLFAEPPEPMFQKNVPRQLHRQLLLLLPQCGPTMMKGTLWKSTSSYVGNMEKRFCVLVGTLVLDFESEEDFLSGAPPKAEGEVIGVSVWKGERERERDGRARNSKGWGGKKENTQATAVAYVCVPCIVGSFCLAIHVFGVVVHRNKVHIRAGENEYDLGLPGCCLHVQPGTRACPERQSGGIRMFATRCSGCGSTKDLVGRVHA